MKLLIIDTPVATLTVDNKTLIAGDRRIPLRLIDVVIVAREVTLSTRVLQALSREKIYTILLNRRNEAVWISTFETHNAELKMRQYRAALTPLPVARAILTAKVTRHAEHLRAAGITCPIEPILDQIDAAEGVESLLGIEGAFSRAYFRHYFARFPKALHHGKRSRQPPEDPVNAMLSYYYMLLYRLIAVRLHAYGFELGIGYLHKPFRGHFALASDVMEFVRARINEEVFDLFDRGVVTSGDFTKRGKGVFLRYEARRDLWRETKRFVDGSTEAIESAIGTIRGML